MNKSQRESSNEVNNGAELITGKETQVYRYDDETLNLHSEITETKKVLTRAIEHKVDAYYVL